MSPIKPVGTLHTDHTSPGLVLPTEEMRYSLSDLSREYVFFNHGILFQQAGLVEPEEDPLVAWYETQPPETEVLRQQLPRRILYGLSCPAFEGCAWDFIVCGVHQSVWPSLLRYWGSYCVVDRQQQVHRVVPCPVQICDPFALRFDAPRVAIVALGLDSSDGNYRWLWTPTVRYAFLRLRPPGSDWTQVLGQGDLAKFGTMDNPADAAFNAAYAKGLAESPQLAKKLAKEYE